jgi:hypothetical protein
MMTTVIGVNMSDDYKQALYTAYFKKVFPDVDPLVLTEKQWHTEAPTSVEWLQMVRAEFVLLQSCQNNTLGDHEFKIARSKWLEYYD